RRVQGGAEVGVTWDGTEVHSVLDVARFGAVNLRTAAWITLSLEQEKVVVRAVVAGVEDLLAGLGRRGQFNFSTVYEDVNRHLRTFLSSKGRCRGAVASAPLITPPSI